MIETSYGNHAPAGEGLSLRVTPGTAGGASSEHIELPGGDGFRAEAESFARMVRLGAAEWNGATEAESIDTALTLEAIRTSMREGGWATLGA